MMHRLRTSGHVDLRTLYLRPEITESLPGSGFVLSVSPLLRELILRAVQHEYLVEADERSLRLVQLLVHEMDPLCEEPLSRPMPLDPRARRVAERLLAEPSCESSLEELVVGVGASARTIARLFRRETGMTFLAWRQRVRVLRGMELLAGGRTVSEAAFALDYGSASAFIAMFRRELGVTPGAYFDA
ncbi:MAG: helix-turn-helix transcriptional regulator [Planctomycetota bacterium]